MKIWCWQTRQFISLTFGYFEDMIFFSCHLKFLLQILFPQFILKISSTKTKKEFIYSQIRSISGYYFNRIAFNVGEAKRRKDLGLPPREKDFVLPEFNKDKVKQRVRNTLYKYPIIPFLFYGVAIVILSLGVFSLIKYYK